MDNWDQRLKDQVKRGWENYRKKRIHLDTARVDERFSWTGDFMYVEGSSAEAALAGVKLNRNTNESLALQVGTKVKTVFTCFYFSNTAQAGQWIDLIVGVNFEKYDTPPDALTQEAAAFINVTGVGANDDVTFTPLATTEIMVGTDLSNTGAVWVNLDAGAAVDTGWELDPGDHIRFNIGNMRRLNLRIVSAGDKVLILRTV